MLVSPAKPTSRADILRRMSPLALREHPAPEPDKVELTPAPPVPSSPSNWKKKVVLGAAALSLLAGAAMVGGAHGPSLVQGCTQEQVQMQVTVDPYGQGPNSTLWGILEQAGYSDQQINSQGLVQQMVNANHLQNGGNLLQPGQVLSVPGKTMTSSNCAAPNPFHDQFLKATQMAHVPAQWADDPALLQLVQHESSFRPDALNGASGASGLFQMLATTWQEYLPEAPYGSTDVTMQAVGGFRYIQQNYQTPERAWQFWQATVNDNASQAPAELQAKASLWIQHGWGGY